ncbi:MAG: nickel pincer cofactor biosynthesis protein LarB [Actinomycetota bacterium]
MRPEELERLLTGMSEGRTSVDEALTALRRVPTEDLGFARLDTHRELRQGLPEAIYAEGKTSEQVLAIASRLLESTTSAVLATRCSPETAAALVAEHPEAIHHDRARLVVLRRSRPLERGARVGAITVVCAGTSDLPVADEAAATADALGADVMQINDVGVAGVHRVLEVQDRLHEADVVVVVAGMEGALASLVGGISSAPVIAVPTSVGYGASFEGLAALLAMLNSCAAGITVTNIDNGFGAAVAAMRILRKIER